AQPAHRRRGKRARVERGPGLSRDALRAAHLHAEARIAHELEQAPERALVDPERGVDAPHVVDHPWHRRTLELGRELADERALEVYLQMPAELRQARSERDRVIDRRALAEMTHEV